MVAPIILTRDENGDLRDQEGHLHNEAGQKLNAQNEVIPEPETAPTGTVQPVEAARTLADYNRPDQFYTNRSAIRPPAIQRGDFELKPQYYTLVGQTPYYGLSKEHPMDHLERFEDLISAIKANGVPVDYLLCKLFKYSLSGEALQWLKQLPPGSLTSWSDIKNAFLRNFFDDARAEDLRRKIATFNQEPGESFKDTWIRFKSYQRDCPHHGFNKVQLLCTFFRGIALKYQMALDTASEGNFTTRNPEDAVKLIDNLASSNSTKNIVKARSAAFLGKEQFNEVQVTLDNVQKLLNKQICLVEEAEADEEDNFVEAEVNWINGTGFQRSGNQGNKNFSGQKGNFNSSNPNNNRSYGNSSYMKPPAPTPESKLEEMLSKVLESQLNLEVNFNGKIDSVYTTLNTKLEALNTQVKKLETQVIQTGEAVKKQEALAKGTGEETTDHHVNAIIEDDFWRVVKHEKLQEGDFQIESSMSIGGNLWYRPMSAHDYQSIYANSNRSTDSDEHRPMDFEESTHECNAVKILTHEEFAAKHPHPPRPYKIDRHDNPVIDRQTNDDIDRRTPEHIDRYSVTTRRVQLPKIDVARLNSLRDQSKPTKSPPEVILKKPTDTLEPMELQQETEGRILRKRKEKTPKHLKRGVNEKELESFRKRVLRIPKEKPFEEAYFSHRLWMFFRETKETEEDIRRMFNHVRETMIRRIKLEKKGDPGKFVVPCSVHGINFPRALCDTGSGVSILPKVIADHLGLKIEPTEESFIFVDCSQQNSGGIIRNLEVNIGETLVPVDFHVLDVKVTLPTSLLLGRAFLATVGAVCNLQTNKLCLTLINPTVHYDPVRVIKVPKKIQDGPDLVAVCFCGEEYDSQDAYETDPTESIDTEPEVSIDTHESPSIDRHTWSSIDTLFKEIEEEFPEGDFKPTGWENDYYIPPQDRDTPHIEEYTDDYEEERAIEYHNFLRDEDRLLYHSLKIKTSIDRTYIPSTDTTYLASLKNYDKRDGDYSIGSWASNYQHESFAVETASPTYNSQPEEVSSIDASPLPSTDRIEQPSTDPEMAPSTDTDNKPSEVKYNSTPDFGNLIPDEFGIFRDSKGFARSMDGRTLQISKEDIADVLQVANGSQNLFQQHRYGPNHHHQHQEADTTTKPKGAEDNHLNNEDTAFQQTSTDRSYMTSIDVRPEFRERAFRFGVRKFFWEQRDEYGVYRDEKGFARGVDGDVIKVSKDDIKKLLERTSMDERSYICLPEHASSFTRRDLVHEIYTKDEINEMFTGLLGERKWEKLSMEKSIEDATDKLRSEMGWMFSADQALSKKVKRLEQELEDIRNVQNFGQTGTISIDGVTSTLIDTTYPPATTYSKREIDESLGDI